MDRTFTQIPTLGGKWLRVARAGWLAAILLSLVLTSFGAWRWKIHQTEVIPAFRALGLALERHGSGGVQVAPMDAGPAVRAGVTRGVLVTVDGAAVPRDATPPKAAAMLRGRAGTAVTLTVRAADGRTAQHRLVREAPPKTNRMTQERAETLRGAIALVYVIGLVSVAVLLFARRPGDPAALTVSLSLIFVSVGNALAWQGAREIPELMPLLRTCVWAGMVLGFWFFCIFPDGRIAPAWTRGWMAVAPAYAAVIEFVAAPRWAPVFFGLIGAGMVLGVVAQVQRYRRVASATQQQQTKWVVVGVAAAVVLFVAGGLVVPLIPASVGGSWGAWQDVVGEMLTTWGLLPIPAGLAISLLRYRLWDADAVLSRSAAYALLTVALAAAWAGMSQAAQGVLGGMLGADTGATAAALAAALTVALFNPAHDRVRTWADRRFLHDLVDFRERLPTVVGDLRETEDLDRLLDVVLARACRALRCGRAAVFVGDDGQPLALAAARGVPSDAAAGEWPEPRDGDGPVMQDWSDAVFPVRVRLAAERGGTPVRVGWLALGPRPDGSAYGRDELEALATIAGPVARAVWIVRAREQHDAELERRLRAAEDELR
ncbi:MAG TPA: hypothetical protein VFS20_20630, partial [Longimicrobium sp.]|nr:hypothetical protein [Longimicrobium sp.]